MRQKRDSVNLLVNNVNCQLTSRQLTVSILVTIEREIEIPTRIRWIQLQFQRKIMANKRQVIVYTRVFKQRDHCNKAFNLKHWGLQWKGVFGAGMERQQQQLYSTRVEIEVVYNGRNICTRIIRDLIMAVAIQYFKFYILFSLI